jgi:glyoxylase-like metal-dependent hydrolase (beta-lactamase superfamily II)
MHVSDGIAMLDLDWFFMGRLQKIHPTLLFDEQSAILVDVGMPGHLADIQREMEKAGVPFERLKAVILTHHDIDHIGSIQEILAVKQVPVYAHKADKPYIQGDEVSYKSTPEFMSRMLADVPDEIRQQMKSFKPGPPPTAPVAHTAEDGEILPFLGGLTVIFTPGHTPGHISLYHQATKTVITGDATVSENGKLLGPIPGATPNMPLAFESLKKFSAFDIKKAICYHGGLCTEQVNEQFAKLANSDTKTF